MSEFNSTNVQTNSVDRLPTRSMALKISLVYALLAALWILCTHWTLNAFVQDPWWKSVVESARGWLFVSITALILLVALDRYFRVIRHSSRLLGDSQERYRLLVEASNEAIWVMDAEHRATFVNGAMADLLGMAPSEILGRKVEEFFFPEDAAEHEERMKRRHRGDDEVCERRFRRQDGSAVWVIETAKALQNEKGEFAGSFSMLTDITERKKVERLVEEEAVGRRILIEESRDGIVVLDENGKVHEANQRYAEMLGYTREEMLQLYVWDWDGQWTREELLEQIRLVDATGDHFETRQRRKDGSFLDVELSTNGAVVGDRKLVFCVGRDISQRKRAETALRESEARYRSTLDNMLEGCQLIGFDWRYKYLNQAAAQQGRTTIDALLGRTMTEAYPGIESTEMYRSLKRCMSERTPQEVDSEFIFPDGSRGWFQFLVQPTAEGIFILSVDITDRTRLEAQLRQAQKLEAIGQLAGGVAHDFNNILAAIMMHLGLLKMSRGLTSDTRRALNELEVEANRAAALTRQLLMFSRRSVLSVQPLDVNEAVANLLKMLGRLIGENIDLRFSSAADLPLVAADIGMLEQILVNLVVNARDALPRGGSITITTTLREFDEDDFADGQDRRPGRFVALSVADNGCGMDAETLKHIFEPFFTTKEAGKGTGLGLATVHGIVAQHGGWMEVDSQLDRGTTFHVWLPVADGARVEQGSLQMGTRVRRGEECILVVEDDETLRRLAARSLERLGYRVYTAANGHEAMDLYLQHEQEVSLLLTDMVMPEGMTGMELAEHLQSLKPGLGVIIASGYSADMVQAGVPTREGVVYLPKPFKIKMLADTVRECLDRRRQAVWPPRTHGNTPAQDRQLHPLSAHGDAPPDQPPSV